MTDWGVWLALAVYLCVTFGIIVHEIDFVIGEIDDQEYVWAFVNLLGLVGVAAMWPFLAICAAILGLGALAMKALGALIR